MRTLIKGGRVIDPANNLDGLMDVLIQDGKIHQVGGHLKSQQGDCVLEVPGQIVCPGFVDLHTHLREPGFEYKETILTGTEAAAAGGFTSVCCMANTNPVNDQASVTQYIIRQAKAYGLVNVFPIGAITKGLMGKELAHMGEMAQAGCVAVSDDGRCVENNLVMRTAMEYARTFNLSVITHSIDPCLSSDGVMHEGILSTRLGLPGIPSQAEDLMIARDIYLAELTGAKLHVAHVSTAEGVRLVAQAKQKGLPVTCEITPHHFTLTDEAVVAYDTNAKMAPPLRSQADVEALIEGMASGVIDAIATDHAPHAVVDKEVEFHLASCGVVGLETALPLAYRLVDTGRLTLDRMVAMLTSAPSAVLGLGKGTLSEGASADVVVFDPRVSYEIDPLKFFCKSKNSPFKGMQAKARVSFTLVAGQVVFKEGHIIRL